MAGEFEGALDEFRVYDRVLTSEEISALSEPVSVQDLLVREKNSWTPRQLHVVRTMFKSLTEDPRIRPALLQWHEAQKQLSACKQTLPTVMVMEEMEAPRPTHILLRGQYDQPGKAVDPAVPGFISKWNENYPVVLKSWRKQKTFTKRSVKSFFNSKCRCQYAVHTCLY